MVFVNFYFNNLITSKTKMKNKKNKKTDIDLEIKKEKLKTLKKMQEAIDFGIGYQIGKLAWED